MNRFICLFSFLLLSLCSIAQINLIRKAPQTLPEQSPLTSFYFLEKKTDTSKMTFLAEINVSTNKPGHTFEVLFYRLKREAKKFGANAFLLKSFVHQPNDKQLTAIVYYANDSSILENIKHKQKNCVYFFSSGKNKADITLTLNGQSHSIKQNDCFSYCLKTDEILELKRFDGTKINLTSDANKTNLYINLQESIEKRPNNNIYFSSGKTIIYAHSANMSTGFFQMNPEYGRLLQEILPCRTE